MAKTFENNEVNKETIYAFRFSTSNKLVHLTQEKLDRIPYLSVLVEHKDDFLSTQNENGEYVLNPPIHYNWFMAILHSITSKQPYTLFTELPEEENVLDTLQLFDYLGIKSIPLPLLKGEHLVLSKATNNDNQKGYIGYHCANLLEARNTAAKFIIALSKNEYNLDNMTTRDSIFSLVMIVFSSTDVFSSRFRHHALTIVKEHCLFSFSNKQQHQLPTMQKITQNSLIDSWIYLYDDDKPPPENFENAFARKDVIYNLIEESDTSIDLYSLRMSILGPTGAGKSSLLNSLIMCREPQNFQYIRKHYLLLSMRSLASVFDSYNSDLNTRYAEVSYISEAKSARSGRFNTLPQRPNVDKFKHRSGPKAQKYR